MPYITIKGFPKDDETLRKVAERFNETLLELWGCRQEHINISYEAVPPEEWDERIEHGETRFHDSVLGEKNGVEYRLVSGDFLKWTPAKIL